MGKTRSRRMPKNKRSNTKNKRSNTKNKTKYGSGITDYFKSAPAPATTSATTSATTPTTTSTVNNSVTPKTNDPTKPDKGFSKSSDYITYLKNTGKGSRAALNMPALLDAVSSKLNALLIHNKVNYKFSNGYTAKDYDISQTPGEQSNDGRGILNPTATRGKITGFQSGVYNTGLDTYKSGKDKYAASKATPPPPPSP